MNFPTLPSSLTNHADSVNAVIQGAQDTLMVLHIQRPQKPTGPSLKDGAASAVKQYATDLKVWESAMEVYKKEIAAIRFHNMRVDALILAFIQKESGLNNIPEQYRNKVFSKAWSDGHSSGYYEVHNQLCELVEIFE